ncbi:MAG: IS630 family transposase [Armatimonadota bacterium]|nr:IS630 family transposase [Armatimonadota bacterium]
MTAPQGDQLPSSMRKYAKGWRNWSRKNRLASMDSTARAGLCGTGGTVVEGICPSGLPGDGASGTAPASSTLASPSPCPPLSHPQERKQRLLEILRLLLTLPKEEGILFQDETEVHLNPKVGFAWMRRGKQQLLPTPGTNQKAVLSGGLNWRSGRLVLVTGARRATDLFCAFLEQVRTRLRRYRKIHVITDQDRSHISKAAKAYLKHWKHRLEVHLLPAWSPDANPMEVIWLVLHQTITVNHSEVTLGDLVTYARQFLEECQPFHLKLPKVYEPLMRQLKKGSVQLSCVPI